MGKNIKCKSCGATIYSSQKYCPNCGAITKKKHIILKLILGYFISFIVVGVLLDTIPVLRKPQYVPTKNRISEFAPFVFAVVAVFLPNIKKKIHSNDFNNDYSTSSKPDQCFISKNVKLRRILYPVLCVLFVLVFSFIGLLVCVLNITNATAAAITFFAWIAVSVVIGFIPKIIAYKVFEEHRTKLVLSNNLMDKANSLDTYSISRGEVMEALSKLAKWEGFELPSQKVTPGPTEGLLLMEQNKDLQVSSALYRAYNRHRSEIASGSKTSSFLFESSINRNMNLLSAENKETAETLLNLLKKYESLVGTIEEADSLEGHEFEHWCADLLRKNGYSDVSVTRGSGDQGVDVLAEKNGVKYAIQCKCYSSDLGNTPVQEVHAGKTFYNCHVGVVMTNRHFTPGAKELAAATGVMLWDRDKLEEFISSAK